MKEVTIDVPENIYQFSDEELNLIYAFCFYNPEGMTKRAQALCQKLMEQLQKIPVVGSGKFKVWE